MSLGILGKKVGMTQVFQPDGSFGPVTVIQAGPCTVVQKKTLEKEAYNAVQVGFEDKKETIIPRLWFVSCRKCLLGQLQTEF